MMYLECKNNGQNEKEHGIHSIVAVHLPILMHASHLDKNVMSFWIQPNKESSLRGRGA